MKIVILTDEYPPLIGGAGTVAKQVKESLESSHKVYLFSSNKGNINGFYKIFWIFYYFSFDLLKQLIKSDLIIVNDIRSAYFLSLFCNKKILNKCVYIVHGTEYNMVYKSISFKNRLMLFRNIYNHFLLHCFRIVAVSKYTKDIYSSFLPEEIKCKVEFYYAGIHKSWVRNEIQKIKNKNEFRLVSVSRIEERKGYDNMLSIFKELVKIDKSLKWYIYGSGSYRNIFHEKIKLSSLSNNVFMMDETDRNLIFFKEFDKYSFDLFWLMPKEPEAFGLVFIEAASRGVPSLGVDEYGVKESIQKGISGEYYTSIEDTIRYIQELKYDNSYYIGALNFASLFNSENFSSYLIKKVL